MTCNKPDRINPCHCFAFRAAADYDPLRLGQSSLVISVTDGGHEPFNPLHLVSSSPLCVDLLLKGRDSSWKVLLQSSRTDTRSDHYHPTRSLYRRPVWGLSEPLLSRLSLSLLSEAFQGYSTPPRFVFLSLLEAVLDFLLTFCSCESFCRCVCANFSHKGWFPPLFLLHRLHLIRLVLVSHQRTHLRSRNVTKSLLRTSEPSEKKERPFMRQTDWLFPLSICRLFKV